MYHVVGYHRPASLDEALGLLASGDRVALAGGVHVHHDGGARPAEVVDLQALGLDTIELHGSSARLGAMVRLQTLVDDGRLPGTIRAAARIEQPSTLRTLATIGGTIADAAADSVLLAALLVHEAVVTLTTAESGKRTVPMSGLLADGRRPGELIIDVTIETGGEASIARTGRTPADVPIVAAVGRRHGGRTTLALCGVAASPVLVLPDGLDAVQPVDDHRATAAYRRHLAEVLTGRIVEELS